VEEAALIIRDRGSLVAVRRMESGV